MIAPGGRDEINVLADGSAGVTPELAAADLLDQVVPAPASLLAAGEARRTLDIAPPVPRSLRELSHVPADGHLLLRDRGR